MLSQYAGQLLWFVHRFAFPSARQLPNWSVYCLKATVFAEKKKRKREFVGGARQFWAVVMATIEARVIFSFWKQDNNRGLTSFLTTLFIAAVRAVILAVASPWQPDAASSPTAELVSRAHGRGCRWHTNTHTDCLFFPSLVWSRIEDINTGEKRQSNYF